MTISIQLPLLLTSHVIFIFRQGYFCNAVYFSFVRQNSAKNLRFCNILNWFFSEKQCLSLFYCYFLKTRYFLLWTTFLLKVNTFYFMLQCVLLTENEA